MSARADFQPEAVIRLLGRHRVRWVLIGGLAAITHGAPLVTQDVDICYARDEENLERLAAALRDVRAALRSADPGLPSVLQRLRPQVAAIEVGAGNDYGHPAPSTLAALRAVPHVYRTDRDGTVVLRVTGGRMRVETGD